jgi:hypothetical protein
MFEMPDGGMTVQAVKGAVRVMDYDNIAIAVLMVVCLFQAILIITLLRALLKTNREMAKDLQIVINATKDAMKDVWIALTTLNERIGRHD